MIVTGALCWCGCGQPAAPTGRFARGHKLSRPVAGRLWPRVKIGQADECWEWQGATDGDGYGKIGVTRFYGDRHLEMVHRAAYEDVVGPIPEGMKVLHSCDNPPCCNPAHLSLGTNADNTRDMISKGRHRRVNTLEARRNMSAAQRRRYGHHEAIQ